MLALGNWIPIKDADDRARALYQRHYSARHYTDGRKPLEFVGPGEDMVLLTVDCRALFVWRKAIFHIEPPQTGINCSIFRNEGEQLSSDLIREADELAFAKWPGERHWTLVDPRKIKSTNPGYCFIKAGWKKCGVSKTGKIILDLT